MFIPVKSQPASKALKQMVIRSDYLTWLLAALLALTTITSYWPITHNDFVNYDDIFYVKLNAHVQNGLTFESIKWAFCHTVSCNWHPLTMLSHMLDCQLYGLKPWGHHLTSVLLQALNSVLLFLLLRRLTGTLWRSAWVAAMFALHPLHVESVAWVAERKDVLSTCFGFLALMFYAGYASKPETESRKAGTAPGYKLSFYLSPCYCLALF